MADRLNGHSRPAASRSELIEQCGQTALEYFDTVDAVWVTLVLPIAGTRGFDAYFTATPTLEAEEAAKNEWTLVRRRQETE